MPIKVRCKHCSTVLTVSEKARGRAVKCKDCGARVQVSSGRKKKAKQKEAAPADTDDMFGALDLDAAEDTDKKICPACAAPAREDATTCAKCGVDLETGHLTKEKKKLRKRKGPPPQEFYRAALSDAPTFVRKNVRWCLTTALVWAFTGTATICSVFTLGWYVETRAVELRESGEGKVEITEEFVLIDLSEDPEVDVAVYDGKRYTKSSVGEDGTLLLPGPVQGALQSPPSMFWSLILAVSVLGFGGWAWTLALEIIKATMDRKEILEPFHTDLFSQMAMGFRSIFWPLVLLWPVLPIPVAMWFFGANSTSMAIVWAIIFMVPVLIFLPPALIHLTQNYTYRAWLLNWMSLDLLKTVVASMFVSGLLLGTVLLFPIIGGVMGVTYYAEVLTYYTDQIETSTISGIVDYTDETKDTFFTFTFLRLPLLGMISFFGSLFAFGILSFPAVAIMRVYGMFGYYFRPDLSLLSEQEELSNAGFGPRFLAALIDVIILVILIGIGFLLATLVTKVFGGLYGLPAYQIFVAKMVLGGGASLVACMLYFSSWESGQNRGTLGKVAIGILVLTEDDKPISSKHAMQRAGMCVVSCLAVFSGFAMCAFHPQHRALHDIVTKTKVVWRGETDE